MKVCGPTACGQVPCPSKIVCVPSGWRRCAKPPPSKPTIIGSTTLSVNKAATAASTALPPAHSISVPAAEAKGWLVTTMPRAARAGRFSVSKWVPLFFCQSFIGGVGVLCLRGVATT